MTQDVRASASYTISTSVVTLDQNLLISPVNKVSVYFEGGVRYWRSGQDPTSAHGIPVNGVSQTFDLTEAVRLKMIRSGGSDALAHVEYIYERS